MDFKRVITTIIGLPIIILIFTFSNKYITDIIVSAAAVLCLYEYYKAFKEYKPIKWVGYLCAALISIVHIIPSEYLTNYVILAIPCIVATLFIELIIKDLKINIMDIAITLFSIFYIVFFISFIALLAEKNNGKILFWYIFIISWGTDTFAYITGKTFKLGKHKFSKISPNKSIEGCFAGIIGAIVLSLMYTVLVNKFTIVNISYLNIIVVSIILSILGQCGDFAESSIKRFTNIKDSGNLIPGHGGILDRIDSVIFVAPFAYILLQLI